MKASLSDAIAILSTWVGSGFLAYAIQQGLRRLILGSGEGRGVITGLAVGVIGLGVGMAMKPLTEADSAIHFPLVWFVMPYPAWLASLAVLFGLVRLYQAAFALNSRERKERLLATLIWGAVAVGMILLYQQDPENKIEIIKGAIPLSPAKLALIVALGTLGFAAMISSARKAQARGWAKTLVTQIALLAGSVVFGLPFAFLLVTSFKEDRDMSSANGIIWVPKVQETVPYMDPNRPLYQGTFEGQTVEGTVIDRRADGSARVDIVRPLAIRGKTFDVAYSDLKEIPRQIPLVTATINGVSGKGMVVEDLEDGRKRVRFLEPPEVKDKESTFEPTQVEPVRKVGLRWQNYTEALSFLPPETNSGLVYLKNTMLIVIFSVIGTLLSSSIVAYAFSRLKFPGKETLFKILLSTMMLPGAVTLLPQFLIFRQLGWIDTLYPLWAPAFFGSAFNIFLLRQFFMGIPMELEDAAKIDGCTYLKTFWAIMLPQIKPALAVIAIWTFMGAWNNFMGPLIYVNSPEQMPLSYALQLFAGDRTGEPGLLMAFATLCMLPVLLLFFFAQKYFIEGVTLSGLGGR